MIPKLSLSTKLTYKDDEIIDEKAKLGDRVQCPTCAFTYGAPAMNRNVYQPMERLNDRGTFRCVVCGTFRGI